MSQEFPYWDRLPFGGAPEIKDKDKDDELDRAKPEKKKGKKKKAQKELHEVINRLTGKRYGEKD